MSSDSTTPPSAADAERPPTQLQQARREFLTLVGKLRPELHRYCARMVGSVIDGEDVVQDTLAKGYYELSALKEPRHYAPGYSGLPTTGPSTIYGGTSDV